MVTIIFTKPVLRFISVFLIVLTVTQFFIPISIYAVTSGPTQPEFSTFESVATTNMVNEFNGDFNYNLPVIEVPGPHGSSYPLSLSYHSGITPEEDASWVGYGWSINPGAINRGVRGYPDDDLGVMVNRYMSTGKIFTATGGVKLATSISGTKIGVGLSGSVRYNNKKGWGYGIGVDANYNGFASVGFNVTDGNTNWTASIDPIKIANQTRTKVKTSSEDSNAPEESKETEKAMDQAVEQFNDRSIQREKTAKNIASNIGAIAGYVSSLLGKGTSYSPPMQEFTGFDVDVTVTGINADFLPIPVGPTGAYMGIEGTFTASFPNNKDLNAYGYIYSGVAQKDMKNNKKVSMDRYKERDITMRDHFKYMPIPFNNPDIYSVSGEGVGGNFRFHHRQVGENLPEYTKSSKYSLGLSSDLTAGTKAGIDVLVALGYSTSTFSSNDPSKSGFHKYSTDAIFRNVYDQDKYDPKDIVIKDDAVFPRFIGDLGGCVVYDQQLNELSSPTGGTTPTYDGVPSVNWGSAQYTMNRGSSGSYRSGRSSNISYNTIGSMKKHPASCYTKDEATRQLIMPHTTGSEDVPVNTFLPDNAIGEFAVYTPDGRCYVYGLPVLARKEERISYYSGGGKSGELRNAPYATKYLLTQILSPDYIDVEGDGPTDDDLGGWVKFTYKQSTIPDEGEKPPFTWAQWRIPFSVNTKDLGRIHDPNDNSASFSQGEKQVYVLEQVETATHKAFFVCNKTDTKYAIDDNPAHDISIKGSGLDRLDAYQYNYGTPYNFLGEERWTHQAYFGKWGVMEGWPTGSSLPIEPEWPTSTIGGRDNLIKETGTNQWYGANNYSVSSTDVKQDDAASTDKRYANFSQYLERIELYKKGDGKQIKTVRFEYDYSTFVSGAPAWVYKCADHPIPTSGIDENGNTFVIDRTQDICWNRPNDIFTFYDFPYGLPNSAVFPLRNSIGSDGGQYSALTAERRSNIVQLARYGKLTLKKVWFEYGGVLNAKISPYLFEYAYPNTGIVNPTADMSRLMDKYPGLLNYGFTGTNANLITPEYVEQGQDAWGYYNESSFDIVGKNDMGLMWVNQNPPHKYDPAPYYLKVIKLPSGGEIRVQYEENDYAYVQDRPAMAMVKISGNDGSSTYTIDVENDLGITDATQKALLAKKILAYYKEKEKIGFKFLFAFNSDDAGMEGESAFLNIAQPNKDREYISGYSDVENAFYDTGTGKIKIQLNSETDPKAFAKEYWKTNIRGNRSTFEESDIVDIVVDVAKGLGSSFLNSDPEQVEYFRNFSYLRIPVLTAKRGGGCRVKRVLMYDSGDQTQLNTTTGEYSEGGTVLYGQEYIYKTLDEKTLDGDNKPMMISSGVATNEPAALRQENPLITFMEGFSDKKWYHKPVAGETLQLYEGPLGESLLPAPSIGYSNIIVRNIHTGKSAPGFSVNKYFTYKDSPFLKNTQFSEKNELILKAPQAITYDRYSLNIGGGYRDQGYCFSVNSLHGHVKSTSQYSGVFNYTNAVELQDKLRTLQNATPIETVEYEYFAQKELLPLFKDENTVIKDSESLNGVEMDIAVESNRFIEDHYSLGGTAYVGIVTAAFPAFYFAFGNPSFGLGYTQIDASSISKVISYPTVLKKITTKRDGMVHTVENIAFSPYTGQPVVKMITDEFNGTTPSASGSSPLTGTTILYEIPAASKYPEMGQKSENERFATKLDGYTWSCNSEGINVTPPVPVPLYKGDVLMFTTLKEDGATTFPRMTIITDITGTSTKEYHTKNLYNQPASGKSVSSGFEAMVVVRSGKTNQLTSVAGTVALYGKTRDNVRNTSLSTLAASGVLSASGTKYSDDWDYSWSGFEAGSLSNAYESGSRGRWRPKESYVYRDATTPAVGAGNKIYGNAGTISGAFDITDFNWHGANTEAKWLLTNTIKHYSPHGEPVEETDVNGVYSAARFAHKDAVPSIIASNAKYLNLYFQSYEDDASSTTNKAHTGIKSMELSSATLSLPSIKDNGDYIVKLWTTCETPPTIGTDMNRVGRSGEWILYEKIVNAPTDDYIISITFDNSATQYVDDIRVQPKGAQSTCYVYDYRNLKLLAQFDDQHFASIFQYDGEGKLIRKIKETTRGLKTIAEANYYTPTGNRPVGKAMTGAAKYSTSTAMKAFSKTESKSASLKDMVYSRAFKDIKGMVSSATNERVVDIIKRKTRTISDTLHKVKFDMININVTPEELNAKLLGIDTIKVGNSKK